MVTGCEKAVDIAAEKAAINAVLDSYVTSIENEDNDLYSKILVHDPDMVNFGSSATDIIIGWDALRKAIENQHAALSDTKITQSDVTINLYP